MYRRTLYLAACVPILLGPFVATAQNSPAAPTDAVQCLIAPHSVINLNSPVEGVLRSIAIDRGDHVTKGQVVAKLESGVEQAAVAVARARAGTEVSVKGAGPGWSISAASSIAMKDCLKRK
jgi:multidrug efflux pump subunit AcrA (membrane-fusion protein)